MTRAQKAKEYFLSGYNCSQAVAMAFSDLMNMEEKQVARLTSGFGGGVGRMREVCGTVTGAALVMSALYGYDDSSCVKEKQNLYEAIQTIGEQFRKDNGSVVCRELLGLGIKGADSPVPEERTQQYYKKRPCAELVEYSASILEEYIKNKE